MLNSSFKKGPFREPLHFSVLVLFGLATLFPVSADTTSWTGLAGNNEFTTAGNWDNGAPDSSKDAFISSAGALSINLSADDTIASLTTSGTGSVALSIAANNLTINGGLTLASAVGSTGTVNLTGGSIKVGGPDGILAGSGTALLGLGGGTLQVVGSDLTSNVNIALSSPHPTSYAFPSSYSIIDSNGFSATFSGGITAGTAGAGLVVGDSSVAQTGSVNFSGAADRYIASLLVTGGAATQSAGATSTTEIAVGTGVGSTATYTLSGGTINANLLDSPFTGSGPGAAATLRVGDYGGTGTFEQTGGIVNIGSVDVTASLNIGNQGGHGTYNLSGGTLNLEQGLNTLGRTSGSGTGSTGELNLSGTGEININGSSELVLSNWYPSNVGITQGTGILTQTGGTITVANTAQLILTGNGTGTYNLNGGTLKIGGSSLLGVFGGQSGTYHFNLGGGTIQVKDTNLVTSVHATLSGEATSTIDTNGLNATWNGVIDGDGSLIKLGEGTLTLGAANTYTGTTYVSQGILKLGINDALSAASPLFLQGTTLNLAGFSNSALTFGLSISSDSVIDFGVGHTDPLSLVFGDSGSFWEGGLTLLNFDVLTDKLGFTSADGLTAGQLADITLAGYTAVGLDQEGFVQFQVVPEASLLALLGVSALVMIGMFARRRLT